MDGFKEFTGKNLDDAISEACAFYDTTRERLEIDIVQDAKSGIFGLVGARKAIIRAKRMELRNTMDNILGRGKKPKTPEKTKTPEKPKAPEKTKTPEATEATPTAKNIPQKERKAPKLKEKHIDANEKRSDAVEDMPLEKEEAPAQLSKNVHEKESRVRKDRGPKARPPKARNEQQRKAVAEGEEQLPRERHKPKHPKAQLKTALKSEPERMAERGDETLGFDDVEETENVPRIPLEELDQERLSAVTLEAVRELTKLVVGDVPMRMQVLEGRVNVHLECDENSGLLIGREGQTLAALQYITSRIVSRHMKAAVRVQLDAGDYRSRQDEKLSDLALILAEKVRNTGKAHSTRPLSSYHRRIVHMALQGADDLHTRSSGDGPLKRVIIQRKRVQ